jgi:hypothetical protein
MTKEMSAHDRIKRLFAYISAVASDDMIFEERVKKIQETCKHIKLLLKENEQ